MAKAKAKKAALAVLPVTADGMRFQRLRARLSAARARGHRGEVWRLLFEMAPLGERLGIDEAGRVWRVDRSEEAGKTGRRDVIEVLLQQGRITPDHAATADRMRDVLEALLSNAVRGADIEAAVDLGARSGDPIERWRVAAAASPGEWLQAHEGADTGRTGKVRAAPRAFGYRRVRTARTGGDGVTAGRAEVLQKARTLNRTLAALEQSADRSALRLRDAAAAGGTVRLEPGETDPLAYLVLTDVVLGNMMISAVSRKRLGHDGGAQNIRVLRVLLQGLEFVALCNPFHR